MANCTFTIFAGKMNWIWTIKLFSWYRNWFCISNDILGVKLFLHIYNAATYVFINHLDNYCKYARNLRKDLWKMFWFLIIKVTCCVDVELKSPNSLDIMSESFCMFKCATIFAVVQCSVWNELSFIVEINGCYVGAAQVPFHWGVNFR